LREGGRKGSNGGGNDGVEIREHIKKNSILSRQICKGEGGGSNPRPLKNAFFFFKIKKCFEFSVTKEYAKIFCEVFGEESPFKSPIN